MAKFKEAKAPPDSIEALMKNINKRFGDGSLICLGDHEPDYTIQVIRTQSAGLNKALGVGGVPRGRIIEIYGPEGCGKTGVALGIVAEAQRAGGTCAYIDDEHSLDPAYARMLGVNVEKLLLSQPDSAESAIDITRTIVSSGLVDVVVLDSVASLSPEEEQAKDMTQSSMALQARLMSKALRVMKGIISKTKTVFICVNQIREKVGVMYGNPETTPGGRALRYYSSVRMEVRKGEAVMTDKEQIGHKIKIKIVKNKVAVPFKVAEYSVIYGKGIDRVSELISLGPEAGVITQRGGWFSIPDGNGGIAISDDGQEMKWQGRARLEEYLAEHPDLMERLWEDLMLSLEPFLGVPSALDELPEEEQPPEEDIVTDPHLPADDAQQTLVPA
jgi:recombination protein RecA